MTERESDSSPSDAFDGKPPAVVAGTAPALVRRGDGPDVSDTASGPWFDVRIALGVAVLLMAPAAVFLALSVSGPSRVSTSEASFEASPRVGAPTAPPAIPEEEINSSQCADTNGSVGGKDIDVDGDGCMDTVAIGAGRIDVTTASETAGFSLGEQHDQILIGDWDCDGAATPALYRARTGTVYEYDRWPWKSAAIRPTARKAVSEGTARLVSRGSCDHLEVSAE